MSRRLAGTLTKVVESDGISSQFSLVKSNQVPNSKCQRSDYLLCVQQGGNKNLTGCVITLDMKDSVTDAGAKLSLSGKQLN